MDNNLNSFNPASGCAQDGAGVKSYIELLEVFSLRIILAYLQYRECYSSDGGELIVKESGLHGPDE